MLPISRILVPVDFSERSLGILPYARAVAAQYHAPLTLMHVVSPFFMVPPTGLSGEVWIPVPGSTVTDRAKQLEEWAPDQLEGIEVRRLVYEGDTVGQIVSFATSEKIDLVVISTHGYGVLRRFLIGSVAAKLLHDLECPVLTGVHLEDASRSEAVKITKVLCAVDLGPETTPALSYATRFARDFSAELEVVHVIPALDPSFDLEASAGWRSSVMDKVREELAKRWKLPERRTPSCTSKKEKWRRRSAPAPRRRERACWSSREVLTKSPAAGCGRMLTRSSGNHRARF